MKDRPTSYWLDIWHRFSQHKLGIIGLIIVSFFVFVALYAPLLASSRPLIVYYDSTWYFPLFRYYLSNIYFSKSIDLFFNLLGIAFILFLILSFLPTKWKIVSSVLISKKLIFLVIIFGFFIHLTPDIDTDLNFQKQLALKNIEDKQNDLVKRPRDSFPNFQFDLQYLNEYARLNLVIENYLIEKQHEKINTIVKEDKNFKPYTLFAIENLNLQNEEKGLLDEYNLLKTSYSLKEEEKLRKKISQEKKPSEQDINDLKTVVRKNRKFEELENEINYLVDKKNWLNEQTQKIHFILMPLIRPFHWQDDAGGDQSLNIKLPFIELTRINRQDLTSALIFGSRISLFVGITATLLSLLIGVPLGLVSGFYGGKTDLILSRFVEIWESLPSFFMLLFVVTILETKSIFIIIVVIAIFSWTTMYRFVRGETLRQRELLYVDACKALGFSNLRILFFHLLPNSIAPVIALLPFDVMGAITKEAGLAFLGLGEEESCSWGVLMDEGRSAFPAESALLWPPAIVLTILLIGIAFVGDALSSSMDPKSKRV